MKIGTKFKSYDLLEAAVRKFCQEHGATYYKRNSRTLEAASSKFLRRPCNPALKYYEVKFTCKYGGKKFKSASDGIRIKKTVRQGCDAHLAFKLTKDGQSLRVVSVNHEHNHLMSKGAEVNTIMPEDLVQISLQTVETSAGGICTGYASEKCANLFTQLAKQPTPIGAFCRTVNGRDNQFEVVGQWEQRDLTRMEKTRFQRSYVIHTANQSANLVAVTTPFELNKELLRDYSIDGKWLAILRVAPNSQGVDRQYLEIWNDNSKFKTIDMLAHEKHLNIMVDGRFACLQWSHCGTKLLYSAERYFKTESYFKHRNTAQNDWLRQTNNSKVCKKGEEFLFRERWGDTPSQGHNPSIYIFDVESEEIKEVFGIDASLSCGQAIWAPDSRGVVFVGYHHTPLRSGLNDDNRRYRCAIYHADFDSANYKLIGDQEHDVEEPRFSPDGRTLVYLQSPPGGLRSSTQTMMKCDWPSKAVTILVDEVSRVLNSGQFPGLYTVGVPKRIWSSDSENLILHSIWRSRQELVCVDVVSGEVSRLSNDYSFGCWTLMDVYEDYVLVVRSAVNINPSLVLGQLPLNRNGIKTINWITLDETKLTARGLQYQIITLNPLPTNVHAKYPKLDYEAVFVTRGCSDIKPKSLIVFPHGGPHSVISSMHSLSIEYYCRLGFAVLMVNYRGSVGFGQDSIDSLVGNTGYQDVKDIMFAMETALISTMLDRNRVVIFGGAQNGFLALTIASLFPNLFKTCVARNPVVNIGGMVGGTDIPDWSFVESGLQCSMTSLSDSSIAKAMWERSPIRLVDKIVERENVGSGTKIQNTTFSVELQISIPVLFTLGQIDQQVPHHQGLLMYKALKARNIESRVYMYEDSHSLQKLTSESDELVNCAQWMLKYTE